MPTNVVKTARDEHLWSKAKAIAQSEGRAKDWAYIMGIYKKMKGEKSLDKSFMFPMPSGRIPGQIPTVMRDLERQPKQLTMNEQLPNIGNRYTAKSVVENLGLPQATEMQWTKFMRDLSSTPNEIEFRASILAKAKQDNFDPQLRSTILQRAVAHYKTLRKSNVRVHTVDELKKSGGPYIGPKGGKWANPEHTIPWGEQVGEKGSKGHLDKLANYLKETYGVKISIHHRGDSIVLHKIIVPKESRSKGVGSNAMGDILRFADTYNKTVQLTPSTDFGGIKSKLIKFYKRFGFVENKGKNKDYEISEAMYRAPRALTKAMPRGGTYYKRIQKGDGKGYRYFYNEGEYKKRKDAHLSGEEESKAYMGRKLQKRISSYGEKGCSPNDLEDLAKKFGGKRVAEYLRGASKTGDIVYKSGKLYCKNK